MEVLVLLFCQVHTAILSSSPLLRHESISLFNGVKHDSMRWFDLHLYGRYWFDLGLHVVSEWRLQWRSHCGIVLEAFEWYSIGTGVIAREWSTLYNRAHRVTIQLCNLQGPHCVPNVIFTKSHRVNPSAKFCERFTVYQIRTTICFRKHSILYC